MGDSVDMGDNPAQNQSYNQYRQSVALEDVQLETSGPFPTKLLLVSVGMLVLGCILIFAGFISEIFSVDDPTRGIACWVLGAITFIPGGYYSYLFYRAWKTKSPEERQRIMLELEAVANCYCIEMRIRVSWCALRSFDVLLHLLLLYLFITLGVTWHRFACETDSCDKPIQGWLLGAYLAVTALRTVSFLMGREARNSASSRLTCYIFCLLGVLFPFLIAWAILGTLWYVQFATEACVRARQLPEQEQPWLIVAVLITLFMIIVMFVVVLVSAAIRLSIWRRQREELRLLAPHNVAVEPEERPMLPSEIRALDRYRKAFNSDEDTCTCTICYDDFKRKEKLVKLPGCGHCFHSNCIKDWLKIKALCPYCKGDVLEAMH